MKQFSTIVNTVLACTLVFILFSIGLPSFNVRAATPTPTAQPPQQPQPAVCDSSRSVQVSGVAVVNVTPDRALIKLGVQSNGRSAKEAQARNSATIKQVVKALKSLGIEAKDIATDWYTIEPLYEDYDSLRIKGYRIHNIVEITMRDVTKSNDAIVTAFQAGANEVVDVQFYTSELRKYRDQARELAMKAAREKADALSSAAGADVGCVLTINENTQSNFYGGGWWWYGYGSNQNLMTQNVVQNAAPAGGESPTLDDGPLSTGQISVRAEVMASFGLK
ncbi:26 kDa periplasmic immunogenic protein [Anaerolineales bacterium]|nr:26 kDa periplasmic immunogenic protein [Anaerolineales bacterium]